MAAFLNWEDDFSAYTAGNALPNGTNGWTVPADANADSPTVVTSAQDGGDGPLFGSNMMQMNRDSSGPPFLESAQLVFANAGISVGEECLVRFWIRSDVDWHGEEQPGDGTKMFRLLRDSGDFNEFDCFIVFHGDPTENWTSEINCNLESTATYFGGTGGTDENKWLRWEYYIHCPASGAWTITHYLTPPGGNRTKVNEKVTTAPGLKPARLYTGSNSTPSGMPDDLNHGYVAKIEVWTDVDSGIGTPAGSGTMAAGDVEVSGGGGGTTRYERIVSLGGQRVNLLLDK